jgi:hypothetical protein
VSTLVLRSTRTEGSIALRSYRDSVSTETLVCVAIAKDGFVKVIASDGTATDPSMRRVDVSFVFAPDHNGIREWTLDGADVSLLEVPGASRLWQDVYGEPGGTVLTLVMEWAATLARARRQAARG